MTSECWPITTPGSYKPAGKGHGRCWNPFSSSFSYLDGATGELWDMGRYIRDLTEHPTPGLAIDQVTIHVDDGAAVVSARSRSRPGQANRYPDTYQRRNGCWQCMHACVWPLTAY